MKQLKTLREWAEHTGIKYETLRGRHRDGNDLLTGKKQTGEKLNVNK